MRQFIILFIFSVPLSLFALPTNYQIDIKLPQTNISFGKSFELIYNFKNIDSVISFEGSTIPFTQTSLDIQVKNISNNILILSVIPYELSNFVTVPALKIKAVRDDRTNLFLTYPFPIRLHSSITDQIKQPEPMAEIFAIYDFVPFVIILVILLFIVLIVLRVYKSLKQADCKEAEININPFDEAENALKQLDLTQAGKQYKAYFTAISEITRRFIERTLGVSALEMASSEILRLIKKRDFRQEDIVEIIQHILKLCDRVKYAKHVPTEEQITLSMKESLELIKSVRKELETDEEEKEDNNHAI